MKKLLLCLLLLNFHCAKSQLLTWHEGSVVLATGKVLTGKMSIDAFHDVMLLEQADKRTVYPAHKIQSLYFYDEDANINRRFLSVKEYDIIRNTFKLFEIVVQGEINVLRRQKVRGTRPGDADDFTYHFQYRDEVVTLRGFIKKVYPQLTSPFDERLTDFVKENKLHTNTCANAIRIVEFYDRLIRSDQALAKQ